MPSMMMMMKATMKSRYGVTSGLRCLEWALTCLQTISRKSEMLFVRGIHPWMLGSGF